MPSLVFAILSILFEPARASVCGAGRPSKASTRALHNRTLDPIWGGDLLIEATCTRGGT